MDDEIRKLLASWEDYLAKNKSGLYAYEILKPGQLLVCVGTHHIYKPEDPLLDVMNKYWHDFIRRTDKDNDVLVVEKTSKNLEDLKAAKFDDPKEAVLENAEPGYLVKLAQALKVDAVGFEPTRKETMKMLENLFSRDLIFYYKIAQMTAQWHRMTNVPAYVDFIQPYINREKESSGWEEFEFSLNNFKRIHKEIFKTDFELANRQLFSDVSDPAKDTSVVNKISKENSTLRDINLAKHVIELWKDGKSIFVLYGNSHVINIEPVLKKFCI